MFILAGCGSILPLLCPAHWVQLCTTYVTLVWRGAVGGCLCPSGAALRVPVVLLAASAAVGVVGSTMLAAPFPSVGLASLGCHVCRLCRWAVALPFPTSVLVCIGSSCNRARLRGVA